MPKKKRKKKKTKTTEQADQTLREILDRFRGEATESVRAVWLAGLGALDAVDKESGRILEEWIARGREAEGRTRSEIDELLERGEGWASELRERMSGSRREVEEAVARAVERLGVPTQRDVAALSQRIAKLEAEIARRRAAAEQAAKASPATAASKVEIWLVEPADDGWTVRLQGRKSAASRHPTKKPAVDEARKRAQKAKGGLVLHRQDGSVQSEHSYGDE